jgi:hypothetical protein
MANLRRYGPTLSKSGFATMQKIDNGGWVKFADIKDFAPSASHNTGSPKLPTLEECYKVALESQFGQVSLSQVKVNMLTAVYEFICRQLRTGA